MGGRLGETRSTLIVGAPGRHSVSVGLVNLKCTRLLHGHGREMVQVVTQQ